MCLRSRRGRSSAVESKQRARRAWRRDMHEHNNNSKRPQSQVKTESVTQKQMERKRRLRCKQYMRKHIAAKSVRQCVQLLDCIVRSLQYCDGTVNAPVTVRRRQDKQSNNGPALAGCSCLSPHNLHTYSGNTLPVHMRRNGGD